MALINNTYLWNVQIKFVYTFFFWITVIYLYVYHLRKVTFEYPECNKSSNSCRGCNQCSTVKIRGKWKCRFFTYYVVRTTYHRFSICSGQKNFVSRVFYRCLEYPPSTVYVRISLFITHRSNNVVLANHPRSYACNTKIYVRGFGRTGFRRHG